MTATALDTERTPPETSDTDTDVQPDRTAHSWTISDDDDHYCCLAY
ncbi:hypothetical protein ACWDOP_00205 [Nocardia sp. NPDC003693]